VTDGEQPRAEQRDVRVLARSGTLALVGVAASAALQFALVLVVTRGLGPTGAGTLLEAVALFTIVANLAQFGANTGLVRSLPRSCALGRTAEIRRTLSVALGPVVVVGIAAAAALYALAPAVGEVFFHGADRSEAVADLRIFAVALPLAPLTIVLLSATRGLGSMKPYVLVQNVALPLARLAVVAALVVAGAGGVAAAWGWAVPLALAALASAVALARGVRRAERRASGEQHESARPRARIAAEFWRFSAARGVAGVLGMTVTWIDVLLVGALRSTREAGIYAAASRLSIAGAYALQAVGMAIAPQISEHLARGRTDRVEEVFRLATWWLMALTWPLYLVLLAFAPLVMGLFGDRFVDGHWALAILCVGMLVNLATGNVTVVLLMSGRSMLNLANAFVSLVLNATLNLLLIPRLGITGAALAWTASLVWINLAPLVQVRRLLGVRPPFGPGYAAVALAAIGCFGVVGLAARLTLGMSVPTLMLAVGVGSAGYALLLRRLRGMLGLGELWRAVRVRRAPAEPPAVAAHA
jgi:O-antigen/teichoic acid export membrane protein